MSRLALLVLLAGTPLAAQQKPALQPSDYAEFEYLQAPVLDPHGRWLAYSITHVDERRELRIRQLDRDTTIAVPWASSPAFARDGRHLAWAVGVSTEEQKRLEKEKKPLELKATVRNLASGEEKNFPAVRAFAFDATGRFLALHGYAQDTTKGNSADLVLLDLENDTRASFGNVAEYSWSDDGSLLAMAITTGKEIGNGVQVYDARTQRLRSLDTSPSRYSRLSWRDDAADLAVLRTVKPADEKGSAQVLLVWRHLAAAEARMAKLDSGNVAFGDSLQIAEHMRPRWSEDGQRIAFGMRPTDPDTTAPDSTRTDSTRVTDEELPGMQIWHTSDLRIVPMQKAQATSDGRRTLLAVWTPDEGRVVRVGTDLQATATVLDDWTHAVEKTREPYAWGTKFGRPYQDIWVVDLRSGERTRALEKVRYSWESPGGRYLLFFDGKDYWTHDVRSGARTNVTARLATSFADTAYDTPTDMLPPHGVGGWLEGDRAVLLYDHFDVWRVSPDGSGGERLSDGSADEIIHRVVDLDRDEAAFDADAPLYLSLHGEWSEQRGFARVRPGRIPERLLLVDKLASGLVKADSADVFLYRAEARGDSPDLFVAGPDLASARQLTRTNPFADRYAWARSELVDYTSEAGVRLQGTLLYPVNHDPAQRYPMIVFAYEIQTPQTHRWENPSERSYYNVTTWTQQGYFVLLPDVVFRARDPGVALLEALGPAVGKVVDMGLVDARRVGFIGHSWGGYHGTYVATHSDLFAASIAGAPLTDFLSFMGQIHWTPGSPEVDHWETGQARMEVPYWEDPESHRRNSPIEKVNDMKTPLLIAHGDKDGVVEFFQSTIFYNFARRAGKQMVLLVYEGENHSFQKKPNQIDYHRRILEWFGHYLKGAPAPAWMTEGVDLNDMKAETRRVAEQLKKQAATTSNGGVRWPRLP